MSKQGLHNSIYDRTDQLIGLSDEIWGYAETAFTEAQSAEALCLYLEREGFVVERNVAQVPNAFSARFGSGAPVIGLLGEYDALFALSQQSDVSEKVPHEPGRPGHGCGHNLLGVASAAAAVAVKDHLVQSGASGTILYYGCPGEEGGSGKAFMAREGVFDELDAAFTWHPGSLNIVSGQSSLANIQVAYKYTGISAHAAADPYNGRSALDAVELLNIGVQFMREHMPGDARVHYAITNSGGFSPNVVQPEAEVLYLVRAPKNAQTSDLFDWVTDIARGAALMTQTQLEVKFVKACSNVIPNNALERLLHVNMAALQLPTYSQAEWDKAAEYNATAPTKKDLVSKYGSEGGQPVIDCLTQHAGKAINDFVLPYFPSTAVTMGSTDVGDVSWVCPTAQFTAVTNAAETPGHSWQYVAQGKSPIAHKGMLFAAEVMAASVFDLLTDEKLLEEAKAEHSARVGPDGYICPIPKGVVPKPIGSNM